MTRCTRSSSSSSAPSPSSNKFDVFEFNDDDLHLEKESKKMVAKFFNPSTTRSRSSPSAVTKYEFLQAFAGGSKSLSNNVTSDPIDLDDIEESEEVEREAKCSSEEVTGNPFEVDAASEGTGAFTATGVDDQGEHDDSPCADKEIPRYTDTVESHPELKLLDMVSDDDDGSSQMSSSSASTSSLSEAEGNLEDQLVEHGSSAFEINDIKKVVGVFPDFIQYEDEDLYSTRSRLIFSRSSLKLEVSTMNETEGTFKFEWEAEDIIKIDSCWFGKIETAFFNILLKSKDSREAGNTDQNPGFKLLKFAVYDSCWYKAEEAIKSLDMKYADIWSTSFGIDSDNKGDISALGLGSSLSQKHYFPNFDEAFEEVIYPKGEPDAVSITKRDIELLQPATFINDTIIDFYIKYLKNKLPSNEQGRFHFFNSFFFRKLADLDKDPSSACDGRAAFQRVRKWTRKVNLFEKDFIFIPINYSLHWSLVVICHPGEVAYAGDEEINESSKVPCILHMDSLKGSHKGLKNLFQSYLSEEWKERQRNAVDNVSSKFLNLRFISLELPQQENLYDCGLFLLHYVECFLNEVPINLNPFRITKFSNFLKSNWFPPPEASLKRSRIQNLIRDIFESNSMQISADSLDQNPLSDVPGIIKHEGEADSLGGCCLWHPKNPSNFSTELETDIQYPTASPISFASCSREPGLVSKDLQAAAVTSNSDCLLMSACHQRAFMSPIEEAEELDEETALSLVREDSEVGELASDFQSTSYINNDHRELEISLQGLRANLVEAIEGHLYARSSTSVAWNTLDVITHEGQPLDKIEELNIPDKTAPEYLSTSGEGLADCVVQDSQEANDGHDDIADSVIQDAKESNDEHDDIADSIVQDSQEANDEHDVAVTVKAGSSFQENMNSVTPQIIDLSQNMNVEDDDTLVSNQEPLEFESDKRYAKRPKLMSAGGRTRQYKRRMSKEACLMSCE